MNRVAGPVYGCVYYTVLYSFQCACRRISPDSRYRFYWRRVASFLDCRTAIECEVRFMRLCPEQSHWNQKLKVYRWTPEEDMVCLCSALCSLLPSPCAFLLAYR